MNAKAAEIETKTPDIKNLVTNLNTKPTKIENEIPDTTRFITTSEFNRLTKISFSCKNEIRSKKPSIKRKVDTARYIADKIREKIKKTLNV